MPLDEDEGVNLQAKYVNRSLDAAFGRHSLPVWDPSAGYASNRNRIIALYDYYQAVYQKRPTEFLWAGLGRMAGAAVVGGLDLAVIPGESNITTIMVEIGKAIFYDLAWQHEAYLDDPTVAISLAEFHDTNAPGPRSYRDAWIDIDSGDANRIAQGNEALLYNEQYGIIQPFYDRLRSEGGAIFFRRTRAFTNKIHPYHRDFLLAYPTKDVTIADDRWAWITQPDGMWPKWVAMPSVAPNERDRLVGLTFDDLLRQRFAPVVDALLPVGADDE